jgi:uncharacterized protein (DUF58 family)
MIVRKTFYVILAIIVLAGAAAYLSPAQSDFVFYRVIYLLLAVILLSLVWTLTSLRGVKVNRVARILRQQVGQIFEERIEVRNTGHLWRLWLEIKDESDMPGKQGSRVISNIRPKQQRTFYTRTLLINRGAFILGPTHLISGDPFGLFATHKRVAGERTLVVLPYFEALDYFPEPPGELPGGRAQRRKTLEVTPYAAGVREYAPGDPLNRIHWRTTARKERLIVKEFEQDPQADIWIILDAQEGLHYSQPDFRRLEGHDQFWNAPAISEIQLPPNSFEYAVVAAASIANFFISREQPVGFSSAGKIVTVITPERGERQLGKILETLAFIRPEGQISLMGVIEGQANQIARGGIVVLITTLCDDGILVAIDMLLRRRLRPVVVFIDPEGFGGDCNTATAQEKIRALGFPVKTIHNGDNVKEALESLIV